MLRKCPYCEKEFEITNRLTKKFCSKKCRSKYKSREFYYKNYEKNKKYNQNQFKKWYEKNKKHQHKNVLNNYYKNKEKWKERGYIYNHRKELLQLIPKKCARCGKVEIKEIHHITYDLPKRTKKQTREEQKRYLMEYSKYLRGFCSRFCHRRYCKRFDITKDRETWLKEHQKNL